MLGVWGKCGLRWMYRLDGASGCVDCGVCRVNGASGVDCGGCVVGYNLRTKI